jgi:hypothetical protein
VSQAAIRYQNIRPGRILSTGIAAGFAGGVAEIAWIALYAQLSGTDAAAVADGVTISLFPALGAHSAAVPLGIALHMGLAVLLGAAIAIALRTFVPRIAGTLLEPLAVIGTLVAVWATNFFVVLPMINPGFVELVPLGVALTSKVLFGAAAAFVLCCRGRRAA